MQAITKYKANDGSEWDEPEKAVRRDHLIADVDDVMVSLNPCPDDTNFANGHGYVQQDAEQIAKVKANLFTIANQDGILKWWIDDQKARHGKTDDFLINDTHASWYCRMLDGSHRPLERAYSRLCNIDDECREWGQQYFANNPEKGDQIQLA